MNKRTKHFPRSLVSLLLVLALCMSLVPTAFAAQENGYHDPAEHWLTANNRTNELDSNSLLTAETFYCAVCEKATSFSVWRTPEYTRDGVTALSRNVLYSDGTMVGGEGTGQILDGTPGVDAYYTGYHWTKSMCETCGTINSNGNGTGYSFAKNVYKLYDCAAEFMEDLDETVTYEYADSTYHTKTTTGGTYCCFCYGTRHTTNSVLERHSLNTEIIPQISNGRFAIVEHCSLCDYTKTSYVAAKSVVADFFGLVDGQPHTLTVSDLSESGVRTQIRYGNSADSCTLTSAPSYTEEGQYTVYYEIIYTYNGVEMAENGVANVWLRDTATADDGSCSCGCGKPDCGCQDSGCNGGCCTNSCGSGNHKFKLLDTVQPTCLTLGYSRYLCPDCGTIEKSDYTNALGHAYQSILIRDATCEADGKVLEICSRCGDMKNSSTPKGEHRYKTYTVKATCINPGYTVKECEVCGDRQITDITNTLAHNYVAHVTPATCTTGGQTVYRCDGCGSSFAGDPKDALGHNWNDGTVIAEPSCTGEGVKEYACTRCGETELETIPATGHTPGEGATCLNPGTCTVCGAVLDKATGHNFKADVTAPTCLKLGYTTFTCESCGYSYKSDYTDPLGHDHKPVVTEPTCTEGGYTTYICTRCEDSYVDDYTDALGHAWDNGRIVTDSVCDGEGVMEYRCERCGYHRLEAVSEKGHTPGEEATCTAAQLCTICGAVLAEPTGHSYKTEVSAPTCTELGYTTYTCEKCGDSYDADYVNAAGHTMSDWIVDKEATTSAEGSKHRECVNCGEVLETAVIGRIYLFTYTDTHGEAVVGDYLVTVTDTSSEKPIHNAAVTLNSDGTLSVVLPDNRLLDYAAQATVTVQMKEDKAPVADMGIVVTDKNDNYAPGKTDTDGKLIVPSASNITNTDGKVTIGGTDKDNERMTLTVKVEDYESRRPIAGATVEIKNGVLHVMLPDGTDMDTDNRILVTVLDNTKKPVNALDVTVKNDLGNTEKGQTNKDGKLIVPSLDKAYTDEAGTAIVGKYTVIVSDSGKKPVVKALVTLIEGKDGKKDAFTVLLPDGRLLDANDQTTVTVLLPSEAPAVGLNVEVLDKKDNHAAKDTDKAGQITVPDTAGNTGETIGTDTGKEDESNTIRVSVADEGGREIPGADISVDDKGNVSIKLPDGFTFEKDGKVTVTVTDNKGEPKKDVSVSVTDVVDVTAEGKTDKYGKLTVPADVETEEHTAYILGYPDGTFGPSRSMTRSEAAAIFARLLAAKNGDILYDNVHCSFSDVSGKAWYAGAVKYLETFGIIEGYEDGTFRPEKEITRAEFVVMSVRFYEAYGIKVTEETKKLAFTDVSKTYWAADYINEASASGWIVGYGNGTFGPDKEITRAEVVTIVGRVLGREADRDYISANTKRVKMFPDVPNSHWAYYAVLEAANTHTTPVTDDAERWLDN